MKITHAIFCFLTVYACHFQAVAQSNLNRIIKEQQNNDDAARKENRLDKKDVYSTIDVKHNDTSDFPVEENCFTINELVLEGDFLQRSSLNRLKENIAHRCIGMRGVEKAVTLIQDYFINAGYITTRIEIPDQDLTLNKLTLKVIPGRIEQIKIENNDVYQWILPFKPGDVLNIRDIEQGLENLQRVPGVDVKIGIEPGSRDGYSNVAIATNRYRSWNLRATYNNWGDESTGRQLAGGAGYLYNLTGSNDIFYLSGSTSTTGNYKSLSAYYSIPFGYWDYELFYSRSSSRQGFRIADMDLSYRGENNYFSAKASRTLFRNSDKKITGSAELIRRKADYRLNDIALLLQKRDMGNVRFGLHYKQNYPGAALNGSLSYQRFLTWFGGTPTPDMKTGEVSEASHMVNLDLNYIKLLRYRAVDAYYDVKFGAQYSPDPLTLQDQFTLGSRWNVRGFENSSGIYGDKGFYLQNTLNFITGFKGIELYTGVDYGQISGGAWDRNSGNSQKIIGAVTGAKGSAGALGYDFSLSAPLFSPDELNIDKFTINFHVFYQL
ncbi:ShlB/FhaC/HecB family hemolysin secretion/activation protein [Mixta tenebrionis]|uniref:ShlB/FhaC/HecB family hemolysin secretion/activation protein n=1 Tax=Mixta tenebrionis TaxID=2562439 RepID=A0A506VGY0_9GAMM|nr:ShlB/FhaC/HecB family hemolysin secretion/activation protein [Mixta tenebrionis]TPW44499.1 ShlB/FhaC/HecB family hemolysin secretion/activation protein [Mixta tenebrionis]